MTRPHRVTCPAAGAGLAVAAALLHAAPAHAELLYEFTFHATVTQKWGENPDHPWGGVEIGDPASFTYVIDVEQEDQVPDGSLGIYDLVTAEISYGGIAVVPRDIGHMEVDLLHGGGSQSIDVVVRRVWTDNFFEGGIFRLTGFNVLPDDAIPIDFDLFDFTTERSIEYGDGTIAFRAVFDSYEYQIVPAPGAAIAIALGVMFRGGRRRRR